MNLLKRIPIHYKGELHDVRLINFSVDLDEIKDNVPAKIKVRNFNNRAMISMVDVKLKHMHPTFLPSLLHFNYRHIAFRLLVDDNIYNSGVPKGIFFYKAFTNRPIIVAGGKLLTDYRLSLANIEEKNNEVMISQDKDHVRYCIDNKICDANAALKETVGALDRAYSILGDTVRVTEIQREKWPIQQVNCTGFENTFFETAKLEGAFRVFEVIYYDWLPPKSILP